MPVGHAPRPCRLLPPRCDHRPAMSAFASCPARPVPSPLRHRLPPRCTLPRHQCRTTTPAPRHALAANTAHALAIAVPGPLPACPSCPASPAPPPLARAPSSALPRPKWTPQQDSSRRSEAPKPARLRPGPPERCRHHPPPAAGPAPRRRAVSGHPETNPSRPGVELASLLPFPHLALAAGELLAEISAACRLLCSNFGQGPPCNLF